MIPKIHIIEDTTVSTEQYHIDLTGAKHRVREADELRSNMYKSAQQTRGTQRSQSPHSLCKQWTVGASVLGSFSAETRAAVVATASIICGPRELIGRTCVWVPGLGPRFRPLDAPFFAN